jgi:hypothetical protein
MKEKTNKYMETIIDSLAEDVDNATGDTKIIATEILGTFKIVFSVIKNLENETCNVKLVKD